MLVFDRGASRLVRIRALLVVDCVGQGVFVKFGDDVLSPWTACRGVETATVCQLNRGSKNRGSFCAALAAALAIACNYKGN
jgi:hypothetical protein